MAQLNTIINENFEEKSEEQDSESLATPKKQPKKKSILKSKADVKLGTSLDVKKSLTVKIPEKLPTPVVIEPESESDSDDEQRPALVNVDVDIDLDANLNLELPDLVVQGKKKSSSDSTPNTTKKGPKKGRPRKTEADYLEDQRQKDLKQQKVERMRQRASDARAARTLLANKRFEDKAKAFMEQELKTKEEQERLNNTIKENEELRKKLEEIENMLNSNMKKVNEPELPPIPPVQVQAPEPVQTKPKKHFSFM